MGYNKSLMADGGEEPPELGSLSGEWVRERMYVCSACRWESPCLWTMEDHKFLSHPRVHCPQHELIGEQAALSKTVSNNRNPSFILTFYACNDPILDINILKSM